MNVLFTNGRFFKELLFIYGRNRESDASMIPMSCLFKSNTKLIKPSKEIN